MRVTRRESLRLFSSGLTATAVSLRDRPYDCLLAEKALDRAALLRLLGTSPVAAPPFAAERVLVMDPEFPVTQEAAAHVVPMAHNFCLTHGVQWSTRELCRRLSRRLLISQLPTSSLARRSVRTSWHWLRLTQNVET